MTHEITFLEENSGHWAQIILPLALPNVYTYSVPPHLIKQAQPGCRVEVVLGKNKKYAGIIKSIIVTQPDYKTKPILNVLDDEPLLYKPTIKTVGMDE